MKSTELFNKQQRKKNVLIEPKTDDQFLRSK